MISDQRLWELSLSGSKYDDPIGVPTVFGMANELIILRGLVRTIMLGDLTRVREFINSLDQNSRDILKEVVGTEK